MAVLYAEDLTVVYRERDRSVVAVDGATFELAEGRTLALVGESGCGKTSLALAVMDLVGRPGSIDRGRVLIGGRDLLGMTRDEQRAVRGRDIAMIFQDATSGLNPVLTIGSQVEEMVRAHVDASKTESRAMTVEALRRQRLPDPERLLGAYPFQLSGGQCQRVMIAIATVLRPRVLIADEPTSSLDVTVQAGILHELRELQDATGAGILLITHDLGVVAQMAHRIAVMYAGRIVEQGDAAEVFAAPRHPYMAALLATRPRLDGEHRRLAVVRGAPPDLGALDGTCAFLPRCTKAISACRAEPWPASSRTGDREVACFNPMYEATVVEPA